MSTGPWSVIDISDDVDDKLNTFNLIFDDLLDLHAPIKEVKIRSCLEEIRALMKTRDYWRKLARKTNNPLAWAGYKNFKSEVGRELRLSEREYAETQIMNNSNNTGCIWKTIRSFIPKKALYRKSYSKEDMTVVNEFNKYFTSIGQNTIHNIQSLANECNYDLAQSSFVPKCYPSSQQFTFGPVERSEIEHLINSMPTGNQFILYLELHKRLSTKQSGNKKWHLTETSLIHTTDTILNAIDEKKTTAMVLLDMSKAFDSISHKILLYKLQDLGASTSAID